MLEEVAGAVDRFLGLVRSEPSSVGDIEQLIIMLDELAWLAHGVQYEPYDAEYPSPPEFDLQSSFFLSERCLHRMRHGESDDNSVSFEAMMDLSEIINDIEEVQWRFNNTSQADALFHYQFGFYSHWGYHLRSLQKALHEWYW